MEDKLKEKTEEKIKEIISDDITPNNLDHLYKLVKIKHIVKEDENMNYGEYGGKRPGHGSYGGYGYGEYNDYDYRYGAGSYGRRGVDSRYRGYDGIDRMADEYGRYSENRGRYGAENEETDRSFHYMVKALEDFIKVLEEEAETQSQKMQLKQALQNSMR